MTCATAKKLNYAVIAIADAVYSVYHWNTNQSLIPTKKKLEELNKTNKKLDDELRKQYIITKHKHR